MALGDPHSHERVTHEPMSMYEPTLHRDRLLRAWLELALQQWDWFKGLADAGSTREYHDTWVHLRLVGRAHGMRVVVVASELAGAARQEQYVVRGLQ